MSLKKVDISIGLIKLNSSFVCLKELASPIKISLNFLEVRKKIMKQQLNVLEER